MFLYQRTPIDFPTISHHWTDYYYMPFLYASVHYNYWNANISLGWRELNWHHSDNNGDIVEFMIDLEENMKTKWCAWLGSERDFRNYFNKFWYFRAGDEKSDDFCLELWTFNEWWTCSSEGWLGMFVVTPFVISHGVKAFLIMLLDLQFCSRIYPITNFQTNPPWLQIFLHWYILGLYSRA